MFLFKINFVATNTTMNSYTGGGFLVEINSSDDEQVNIMGVSHDSTLREISSIPKMSKNRCFNSSSQANLYWNM